MRIRIRIRIRISNEASFFLIRESERQLRTRMGSLLGWSISASLTWEIRHHSWYEGIMWKLLSKDLRGGQTERRLFRRRFEAVEMIVDSQDGLLFLVFCVTSTAQNTSAAHASIQASGDRKKKPNPLHSISHPIPSHPYLLHGSIHPIPSPSIIQLKPRTEPPFEDRSKTPEKAFFSAFFYPR